MLESQLRTLGELRLLLAQVDDIVQRLNSVQVNQELLKGEIREVKTTIERLGTSIAPGAGLEAVGVRFAELRDASTGSNGGCARSSARRPSRARPAGRRARRPRQVPRRRVTWSRTCSTTPGSSSGSGAIPRSSSSCSKPGTSTCSRPRHRWSTSAAAGVSWSACSRPWRRGVRHRHGSEPRRRRPSRRARRATR